MSDLARLLDVEALDSAAGPWGRLTVDVPESWFVAGDAVDIVVPRLLRCARCSGGGCDGCGRSGALRLEGDEHVRTVRLSLPHTAAACQTVRLVRPLTEDGVLEQLWVELRVAAEPSSFCRRVARPEGARDSAGLARAPVVAAIVVSLALAIAALIAAR